MLLSAFISSSPSSLQPVSVSLFSMSASVLLQMYCLYAVLSALKIQVHQYHLSRFHIYVLIHDICFSFSDLFHSA